LLTTVTTEVILELTCTRIRLKISPEVVVVTALGILMPDTVNVVSVGSAGDVDLALVDYSL
jgi:hypothetical protein